MLGCELLENMRLSTNVRRCFELEIDRRGIGRVLEPFLPR